MNIVTRNDTLSSGGKNQQQPSQNTTSNGVNSNYRGYGRSNHRGSSTTQHFSSSPRPMCQVCEKLATRPYNATIVLIMPINYQGTSPNMVAYLTSSSSPLDAN